MQHAIKMSLKAFWEAVEQQLATCSAEELRAILRAMAQDTLPKERQAFLGKLKPGEDSAAEQALIQEGLLADIDDFVVELQDETENAEPYEDRYRWDDYYDDEDSLGPYEEFVEPLTALFDRAEAVFDYGNLTLARAAYQKLFGEALGLEDDYGRGIGAHDLNEVDIGEARARYLRAVYETEPPAHRPETLFEQMRQVRSWLIRADSTLDDVIQISPKPLPDQDQFLTGWIAFLRRQSGPDADAWLREAIRISQGTSGLEKLARVEGEQRPRAYLDWFAALQEEGKHQEVLDAAHEALRTLPEKLPIRAAVADHLCAAAEKLNDTEARRAGRWEAFRAKPTLARLLDLWEAAPTGAKRTEQMQPAARYVEDYLAHPPPREELLGATGVRDDLESPAWIDKSVLAHAQLLAGEHDAARQLVSDENVLGWSSSHNPQGLLLSFFLVLLSGKLPGALPPNMTQLWRRTLQNSIGFGSWSILGDEKDSLLSRLVRAYTERLPEPSLSSEEQEAFLSWCLEVAERRVNAIVGNKKRRSYDKAAELITACAETLRVRGKGQEADTLLAEASARFPRHRAFQAELKSAIQAMKHGLR